MTTQTTEVKRQDGSVLNVKRGPDHFKNLNTMRDVMQNEKPKTQTTIA